METSKADENQTIISNREEQEKRKKKPQGYLSSDSLQWCLQIFEIIYKS